MFYEVVHVLNAIDDFQLGLQLPIVPFYEYGLYFLYCL